MLTAFPAPDWHSSKGHAEAGSCIKATVVSPTFVQNPFLSFLASVVLEVWRRAVPPPRQRTTVLILTQGAVLRTGVAWSQVLLLS